MGTRLEEMSRRRITGTLMGLWIKEILNLGEHGEGDVVSLTVDASHLLLVEFGATDFQLCLRVYEEGVAYLLLTGDIL